MIDWDPIDTVPEGVWVFVYDPHKANGYLGCGQYPLILIDGVWYEHWYGNAMIGIDNKPTVKPTHWAPLLDPPEE